MAKFVSMVAFYVFSFFKILKSMRIKTLAILAITFFGDVVH